MKIVINSFSARQGGGRTYLKNLLAHLPVASPLEILVFAPDSLTFPDHPRVRRVTTVWPTTNPLLRTLWEKMWLPAFLRREAVDVLFCPGGVVTTHVPRGVRTATMFRNMIPFDYRAMAALPMGLQRLRSVVLRRTMLRSMRKADLTIFISNFAREVIERLTTISNPTTIPHGISEAFRVDQRAMAKPSTIGDEPYLLYVSKFDTYKHHIEVVEAYSMLPDAVQAQARLILVGEVDHASAQAVADRIATLGLTDRVIIHGKARYEDLPAMYQNAAANLFASSCENCPNILLEALAAGRPVLSSNVAPMPEFGGEGLLYFSPFEPASIARAMEIVLTDTAAAEECAAAALERSRDYDWSVTAQRTWAAIAELSTRATCLN